VNGCEDTSLSVSDRALTHLLKHPAVTQSVSQLAYYWPTYSRFTGNSWSIAGRRNFSDDGDMNICPIVWRTTVGSSKAECVLAWHIGNMDDWSLVPWCSTVENIYVNQREDKIKLVAVCF